MKRHVYSELTRWKEDRRRKPLILKGARQVGKTTILKEFGAKEYEDVAYFNFEEDPSLNEFFTGKLDPPQILQKLSLYRGKKIDPAHTLILFDEIQQSNRALNSLKYFAEAGTEFHLIAAGSLLGIALSKPESFPVGKVNFLTMRPLHFFEFLSALGKDSLRDHLEGLSAPVPLDEPIHKTLVELLKTYLFVGGMPEAVFRYAEDQEFEAVRRIQREILDSYALDFSKHAAPGEVVRILNVWNSIPGQLAKENRKFMFSAIRKSARAREYETSLVWLENAGLIHKAYHIAAPRLPLASYGEKDVFKIYLLDTGLLGAMSNLPARSIIEGDRLFTEFKGALTENYVAQELIANLAAPLHYWTSPGTAEVDFICESDGKIYPLEVKAGQSSSVRSLRVYGKKYSPPILSRTSAMNLKCDDDVVNYPLYAVRRFPGLLGLKGPNNS